MRISEIIKNKKCVFSFEIFPPKKTDDIGTVIETIDELHSLSPDFISVTYGAGGSDARENTTVSLASYIKSHHGIEPLAHLTCVNSTRESVKSTLDALTNEGIQNILALRGDRVPGCKICDFQHASELVALIHERGAFHIAAACYPEGHCESKDMIDDIRHLKEKVDAGAMHLITQLFFENSFFESFVEKTQIAGINVPIQAGIMPIVNKRQIERIVSLCGASLPPKFTKMFNRFADNPEALRDAGINYATEQITDLLSAGAHGIHLYTMNNPYVARKITENLRGILRCVNE